MSSPALLNRANLAPARVAFTRAAQLSRAWDRTVSRAIARFGERPQGGHVSGIYSEHLPDHWRNGLRALARGVSVASDAAYSMRPARVRLSTMRALRSAVRAKYGFGYYG